MTLSLKETRQRVRWAIDRIQNAVAEFVGEEHEASPVNTSALRHLTEAEQMLTEMIEAGGDEPPPEPVPPSEEDPAPEPTGSVPGSPIAMIDALPRVFESDFRDGWEAWAPGLDLPLGFAGHIDSAGVGGTIFGPADGSAGIVPDPLDTSRRAFRAVARPGSGSKREQKTGISIWRHPVFSRFHMDDLYAVATSHTLYLPEDFPREHGLLVQVWQPKLRPGGSGQPWQVWIDAPSLEIRWRRADSQETLAVHRSGVTWPLGRKVKITALYRLGLTDGAVSFWITPEGEETIAEFHRRSVSTLTHFRHPDVEHTGFWPSILLYQIGSLVREDPPVIVPLSGLMGDFVFYDARGIA